VHHLGGWISGKDAWLSYDYPMHLSSKNQFACRTAHLLRCPLLKVMHLFYDAIISLNYGIANVPRGSLGWAKHLNVSCHHREGTLSTLVARFHLR
jgi:hypothetical protein